jgi:hypothetical protein
MMAPAPSRHPGELDATVDDVVQLAVCKILRRGSAQIGNSWVQIHPELCFAASVDAVADGAFAQEMFPSVTDGCGIGGERVLLPAFTAGYGKVANCAGEPGFEIRRLRAGAKAAQNDEVAAKYPKDTQNQ